MATLDVQAIAQEYLGHRSAGWHEAIARANTWAATLFHALDEAGLATELADTAFFAEQLFDEHGLDPEDTAVKLAAIPAIRHVGAVTPHDLQIVEARMGPLPRSYRELLVAVGRLDFLSEWGARQKMLAGEEQLAALDALEWLLSKPRGYTSLASPVWHARAYGVGSPLHVDETAAGLLPVLAAETEAQLMIATRLGDEASEAPYFDFVWMDEVYFSLVGRGALDWLDRHVDRTIASFTANLKEVASLR